MKKIAWNLNETIKDTLNQSFKFWNCVFALNEKLQNQQQPKKKTNTPHIQNLPIFCVYRMPMIVSCIKQAILRSLFVLLSYNIERGSPLT